jgi:hypothetical protein
MENLPFSASNLDAAISQFGFAYASVEQAASNGARVAARRPFSFLVHHQRRGLL